MGRSSTFHSAPVEEATTTEEVVVDEEIDTTPEAVGTATTGSGVVGTIWHYPGEAIYKYGALFPAGFEIWNKPKEFRTYEDAEWFITDVISPARETTSSGPTTSSATAQFMGLGPVRRAMRPVRSRTCPYNDSGRVY